MNAPCECAGRFPAHRARHSSVGARPSPCGKWTRRPRHEPAGLEPQMKRGRSPGPSPAILYECLLLVAIAALLRALAFLLVALVALAVGGVLVRGLAEALDRAAGLVLVARRALQRGVILVVEGHVAGLRGEDDGLLRRGGGGRRGEGEGEGDEQGSEGLHECSLRVRGAIPGASSAAL